MERPISNQPSTHRIPADFPVDYTERLRVQYLRMRDSLNALAELIQSTVLGCSRGEESGPDWAAALIMLAELERDLPDYFALEVRDEYVASAVRVAPRLHRRAVRLLAQHAELCERLTGLLAQAREAGASSQSWTRLQQEFLGLSADLLEHERTENRLIGQAHSEDIGSAG